MSRWTQSFAVLMLSAAVPLLVSHTAQAQTINVDFGKPGSTPSASYGAAGAVGQWNQVGFLAEGVEQPLVDVQGASTAADIYMLGAASQLLQYDNPGTSGDDGALMDDMLISFNDPTDLCLWVDGLVEDDYEVLIYAMTPNEPSLMSRVRVDAGTPGPIYEGGAWPGHHADGITYRRFTVHATGGAIAFHSGLPDGYIQSGMNGFQIRPLLTSSVMPAFFKASVTVSPNPARRGQAIAFTLPPDAASGELAVYDMRGRLVWSRHIDGPRAGGASVAWDGRANDGHELPAGVFIASWRDRSGGSASARIVSMP